MRHTLNKDVETEQSHAAVENPPQNDCEKCLDDCSFFAGCGCATEEHNRDCLQSQVVVINRIAGGGSRLVVTNAQEFARLIITSRPIIL